MLQFDNCHCGFLVCFLFIAVSSLLDYNLFTIINIQSLLGGLATQTHAVQRYHASLSKVISPVSESSVPMLVTSPLLPTRRTVMLWAVPPPLLLCHGSVHGH